MSKLKKMAAWKGSFERNLVSSKSKNAKIK